MKGVRTLVKTIFPYVKGSSDSGSWVLKPKIVPFYTSLKRGKNDAADAEAVCETVTRPTIGFAPVERRSGKA